MEGAPGHQAAGIPAPFGVGSGARLLRQLPDRRQLRGVPAESYVTWGGYDWMTATVGGLWDSLLAEGRPWWITANSDSHTVYLDDSVRPAGQDTLDYFNANGRYGDPVHGHTGGSTTNGDFWPGYYSRTHVGATDFAYAAVMDGLRAGRVWIDHGSLVSVGGRPGPHGGVPRPRLRPRQRGPRTPGRAPGARGRDRDDQHAELGPVRPGPRPGRRDPRRGDRPGRATATRSHTPDTRVVQTYDVTGTTGTIRLRYPLGPSSDPFYVRLRGSDGKRSQTGINGAGVDAARSRRRRARPGRPLGRPVVLHQPDLGRSLVTSPVRVAGGWTSTRDAEHGFRREGDAQPAYVGTGFDPVDRVVVHAAQDVADLPDGTRLFVFPGDEVLTGVVSVREILVRTAIDQVRGLAGTFPSLEDRVDTQEFVRPVVERGRLVLVVRPGHAAGLVPFEQPNPTPCCADHG